MNEPTKKRKNARRITIFEDVLRIPPKKFELPDEILEDYNNCWYSHLVEEDNKHSTDRVIEEKSKSFRLKKRGTISPEFTEENYLEGVPGAKSALN